MVRPMRLNDVPRVIEIASGLPEAPQWKEAVYANALDPESTPARIALVSEDTEGGISGFLITVLIPPVAELETIAVVRAAQRKGVGARLFAALFDVLKRQQISEVMLEVRESNHGARAFYSFAGFVETGRRTGYYSEPKEDAILLSRSVI
jgi:[ribosomal protein S18]-alanine N-acetyltransferase